MALSEQTAFVVSLATSLALLALLLACVYRRHYRRLANNFRDSRDRRELDLQLLEHRYKQQLHPQSDESPWCVSPPSESAPNSIPPGPPSSIGSGSRRGSDGGYAESDAGSSRGGRGRGSSRAGSEVASDTGATSLVRGRRGSGGGGAESDAGSSRGGRGRGSSRAGSEVASDAGATSLAREVGGGGEGGGVPENAEAAAVAEAEAKAKAERVASEAATAAVEVERLRAERAEAERRGAEAATAAEAAHQAPEPDSVHYAVTGPAVVEDVARSFVVQVWAMIAAKMALFKDALDTTEKRYTHTLDELDRAVTDFEVTVLVTGCIVEPATQCMHWNRKIK
eukprot:jgi/Chrpa1/26487/Chrysochromulina_OHIO_Genome00026460-RA